MHSTPAPVHIEFSDVISQRIVVLLALILAFLAFAPSQSFGQQSLVNVGSMAEPGYQSQLPPPMNSYPFRYWDKGYFITYTTDDMGSSQPAVVVYNKNGKEVRDAIVSFKDAETTTVSNAAVGKNGSLVVSGGTITRSGIRDNFIAQIDATGSMSHVIRTTPFVPVYVCAADDGTVWSYGSDRDEEGKRIETSLRLRQFSFDKGQLQATLDVSRRGAGWNLTRGRYSGEINFRCTSTKVVLYNGTAGELVTLDIPTNVLKISRVRPLPPTNQLRITGFAATQTGDIFASFHTRSVSNPQSGIFKLCPDSSGVDSWIPVKNSLGAYLEGGPIERLLGTDGTNLIYTNDANGHTLWSKYTNNP